MKKRGRAAAVVDHEGDAHRDRLGERDGDALLLPQAEVRGDELTEGGDGADASSTAPPAAPAVLPTTEELGEAVLIFLPGFKEHNCICRELARLRSRPAISLTPL